MENSCALLPNLIPLLRTPDALLAWGLSYTNWPKGTNAWHCYPY